MDSGILDSSKRETEREREFYHYATLADLQNLLQENRRLVDNPFELPDANSAACTRCLYKISARNKSSAKNSTVYYVHCGALLQSQLIGDKAT